MSLALPSIIVGTSSLGHVVSWRSPAEGELRYFDEVLAAGCTAFDLAASYQVGGTERLFGAWMALRRNRDRIFIITKGGHPFPVVAPHRLTARALDDDLHASLRRLGTDRVDLYFLHRDDEDAPLEPVVDALARFRRQGKILAWGTSNFTCARIEAIDALARSAGERVAASSTHFSLFAWSKPPFGGSVSVAGESHRDARAFHGSRGLPLLAWSPLGAGFASGGAGGVYDTPANRGRRARARAFARERGVDPERVALAYVLHQPFPTFAVTASRSAARMKASLAAADIAMTPGEVRWLETGERDAGDPGAADANVGSCVADVAVHAHTDFAAKITRRR